MFVKDITTLEEFETEVLDSEIPVFVDVCTTECEPCAEMLPVLDDLAEELDGSMAFVRVDLNEADPGVCNKFRITELPTMVIFDDGERIRRTTGYDNEDCLRDWVDGVWEAEEY